MDILRIAKMAYHTCNAPRHSHPIKTPRVLFTWRLIMSIYVYISSRPYCSIPFGRVEVTRRENPQLMREEVLQPNPTHWPCTTTDGRTERSDLAARPAWHTFTTCSITPGAYCDSVPVRQDAEATCEDKMKAEITNANRLCNTSLLYGYRRSYRGFQALRLGGFWCSFCRSRSSGSAHLHHKVVMNACCFHLSFHSTLSPIS